MSKNVENIDSLFGGMIDDIADNDDDKNIIDEFTYDDDDIIMDDEAPNTNKDKNDVENMSLEDVSALLTGTDDEENNTESSYDSDQFFPESLEQDIIDNEPQQQQNTTAKRATSRDTTKNKPETEKTQTRNEKYGTQQHADYRDNDIANDIDDETVDETGYDPFEYEDDFVGKSEKATNTKISSSDDYDTEQDEVEVPQWVVSLRSKLYASVSHAFLLHGNIRDYMVRNIEIRDGIVQVLDPNYTTNDAYFDVIAIYDQAHGLMFYGDAVLYDGDGPLNGEKMSIVYKKRFINQMREAQERLSLPKTDNVPNKDTVALFTIISDIFIHKSKKRGAKMLLFIDYADFLVPDASSAQMKPDERKLAITLSDIGRNAAADEAGNCMIFTTDDITQLSTRVRSSESRIEQINIPLPDTEERYDFIENVLDIPENTLADGTQLFQHPNTIDKRTFAINSAGLSRMQIEDIMLRALSENEPLTISLMKERKQDIIKEDYDDVLEIVDSKIGFERIGGMDNLKRFFREEIIEPVHAGEKESVPMGLLVSGAPGTAKALSVYQTIPTSDGMKPAGNIAPGDMVFGIDGKLYPVIGVAPQGNVDAYAVVLNDKREIICSGDHLWEVLECSHGVMKKRIYTTEEMIKKGVTKKGSENCLKKNGEYTKHARFFLPQCSPVEYSKKDFFLDPYIVGAMLGDGSCTEATLSISNDPKDHFIPEEIARLLGATAQYCKTVNGNKITDWRFVASDKDIKAMRKFFNDGKNNYIRKLWRSEYAFKEIPEIRKTAKFKRIPTIYKYGSIEQRYALIQGLMDTDGTAGSDPLFMPEFASISKGLCDDVAEVLNSLGYSASVSNARITPTPCEFKGHIITSNNPIYKVNMHIPNSDRWKLFRLPRKVTTASTVRDMPQRRHYERQGIADIVKLGHQEEMVCFIVDSPDHLFLAGNYVPTHNTLISKAVAKEAGMNFVALNLNRIMEKWVGSTERNLDRALNCALAMAPTIIFIDEIDEALPNRADPNASSVNKRINQRLLTFFSDTSHRGEVIILAATNYPEKIDPAFKRAGRFDMRIPMFAPDEFDRMRIMQVIAKSRGYSFSWFESPDMIIDNPFLGLDEWIRNGNIPIVENNFPGKMTGISYDVYDEFGEIHHVNTQMYSRLACIFGKDKITLQQFYEAARLLFDDIPQRIADASTGATISDDEFYGKIEDYLRTKMDIIGSEDNLDIVLARLWNWETVYKVFADQTFRMTGAELDVVMNKAINLWKRWKRRPQSKGVLKNLIASGQLVSENDIPWKPFLLDACHKTVNAVAGIKKMEDMALINASDTDFIPDALYAKTDDGRLISYAERHEELLAQQSNQTLIG